MIEFDREDFYPFKNKLEVKELVSIHSDIIKETSLNKNFLIKDISSTELFRDNSILFLSKKLNFKKKIPNNFLIITDKKEIYENLNVENKIFANNLNKILINIINYIFLHDDQNELDHQCSLINGSYISNLSKIHPSVKIGKNCFIGRGVSIGKNTIIKNNIVIKNSIIGTNAIIGDNSVLGSTGFGFDLNSMGATDCFPHLGIVYVSDNVRIGSSCTIDRAKIDTTYIGKNSMLDNLIHIAHNVFIAENACIAAQTGISGSVIIGSNAIIGGQVGFAGHLKIGNNVVVAAKSGVTKNIMDNSTVAGFPAIDIKQWKKNIIKERKNGY